MQKTKMAHKLVLTGVGEGGELKTRDRKCCHTLQSAALGICVRSVIAQELVTAGFCDYTA